MVEIPLKHPPRISEPKIMCFIILVETFLRNLACWIPLNIDEFEDFEK